MNWETCAGFNYETIVNIGHILYTNYSFENRSSQKPRETRQLHHDSQHTPIEHRKVIIINKGQDQQPNQLQLFHNPETAPKVFLWEG